MSTLPSETKGSAIQPDQSDAPLEALETDPNTTSDLEGDGTDSTRSASITSSVLNYKYENGRRYHAFREGEYVLPNDELEQDRLDLHHHIFLLVLDGELFLAPIGPAPLRVLDLGTGTGIWAIDMADRFPSAEVIGTDLSPIQPGWVPPNCRFYVDDIESEWTLTSDGSGKFDFIHGRALSGSVRDWKHVYSQAFRNLKPGGWMETQEPEGWCTSDDDTLQNCPNVMKWQTLIDEASTKFGKKVNQAALNKQYMLDAGFVEVETRVFKVPIGTWPKDRKLKELGRFQLENMCECAEAFALALLVRILGWQPDECRVLAAHVKKEFRDKKNHLYANFHYTYGRKP